ncbi:MAG: hypothetical protein KKF67_01735 [Nanoarchaeota archaeon]|nr:hypothetical protein [Nanoarchaeota archaeon]
MNVATLDELTHINIVLGMILLKQGKRNFRIEDLQRGLDKCSEKYPRLKISRKEMENTFFFYHQFLCGDASIPEYGLNEEGRKRIQGEFDKYTPDLQTELRAIAKDVWGIPYPTR